MAYNYPIMADTAKKMVTHLLAKGKSAKIKVARNNSSIKAVEVSDSIINVEDFFKSISFPAIVTDLSSSDIQSISGKYKAKLIEIKTPILSAKLAKGEKFFFLNTHTEKGSVKTKTLVPSALGLTLSEYTTLDSFDRAVAAGILRLKNPSEKVPSEVQLAIEELYKSIVKNKTVTSTIPYTTTARNALEKLKPDDRQAIGKDFGEILSLRWYLTQPHSKGWTKFGFETGSNAALVDYYVYKKVKNWKTP